MSITVPPYCAPSRVYKSNYSLTTEVIAQDAIEDDVSDSDLKHLVTPDTCFINRLSSSSSALSPFLSQIALPHSWPARHHFPTASWSTYLALLLWLMLHQSLYRLLRLPCRHSPPPCRPSPTSGLCMMYHTFCSATSWLLLWQMHYQSLYRLLHQSWPSCPN